MRNKVILMTGAVLVMAATMAQAIPITGQINMSGTAVLDNTLLGSATKATGFSAVTVGGGPTGSFVGTTGDTVGWTAFGWNPATTPVTPLWTFFDVGTGWTYSFDLANLSIASQNNSFLNLLGTGTLKISGGGYTDTAGYWSFTISNPGGGASANFHFTFANAQTAAVPDGGMSVVLLGLALAGMAGVRRLF